MEARDLARAVRQAILWHDRYPKSPGKRFRGAPKGAVRRIPYGIHPVWAAMTILHENSLTEEIRFLGAQVLCSHDFEEDTTAPRPKGLSKEVRKLVKLMTFKNFDEETELLWERPEIVRLFKLYDKISNWLDGEWMYPERRILHRVHILKITEDVKKHFGPLNITRIAHALCD